MKMTEQTALQTLAEARRSLRIVPAIVAGYRAQQANKAIRQRIKAHLSKEAAAEKAKAKKERHWERAAAADLAAYIGVDDWGTQDSAGQWTDATKAKAQAATSRLLAQSNDDMQPGGERGYCPKCQSLHAAWRPCIGAGAYAHNPALMIKVLESERAAKIEELGPCTAIPPRKPRRCGKCPPCQEGEGIESCMVVQRARRHCGECARCRAVEELAKQYQGLIKEARDRWDRETDYPEITGNCPEVIASEGCDLCQQRYYRLCWFAARCAVLGRRTPEGEWRPGIAHLYLLDADGKLDTESALEVFSGTLCRLSDFTGAIGKRKSPQESLKGKSNVIAYMYGLAKGYAREALGSLSPCARDSDAIESAGAKSLLQSSKPLSVEAAAIGNIRASQWLEAISPRDAVVGRHLRDGAGQTEVPGLSRWQVQRSIGRLRMAR